MIEIRCNTDDMGNEYLPDFTETELFVDEFNMTKKQEQMIMLYNAIVRAENYWYLNTPTGFGNPDHSMHVGFVSGMVCGLGWDYQEVDGEIIIKSGKSVLLKIQKPKKSEKYYDAQKENSKMILGH
jgi:hypothetical protein